jgi:hypothetical protein
VPTYRLHSTTEGDLGLLEHPAPTLKAGDVVELSDGREALVTARVDTGEAPIAALLEVAPWPKRRISAGAAALFWTAVVLFLWLLLAASSAEDCTGDEFLCFGAGDVFMLLALPALVLWGLGLVVIWGARRARGR